MSNSLDFYKRILLHVILFHIIVPWFFHDDSDTHILITFHTNYCGGLPNRSSEHTKNIYCLKLILFKSCAAFCRCRNSVFARQEHVTNKNFLSFESFLLHIVWNCIWFCFHSHSQGQSLNGPFINRSDLVSLVI